MNQLSKGSRELSSNCKRERKRRGGEQEATTILGKSVSHTGVELYLKYFTNRNDPTIRNYQHMHGKVTVTQRPTKPTFS